MKKKCDLRCWLAAGLSIAALVMLFAIVFTQIEDKRELNTNSYVTFSEMFKEGGGL